MIENAIREAALVVKPSLVADTHAGATPGSFYTLRRPVDAVGPYHRQALLSFIQGTKGAEKYMGSTLLSRVIGIRQGCEV